MKRAILALICGGGVCAFAASFPVKPLTCYEATFRARVAKGPNVEDSPQLADIVPICASRSSVLGVKFAAVQWRFVNAAGKTIPRPKEGASPQTLFSREWKTFRYRFWTPEHAARFELFPINGAKENKAELADVAIKEVPPEERGAFNFNGDFAAADDMPWGWQLVGSALFHYLAPGRSSVNTMDGHVNGDLFPVTPGQSVRMTVTASNPIIIGSHHEQTNVRLAFYPSYAAAATQDKTHHVVDPPVSPAGKHATASHVYRVPDGMHWARISVWHGIAEKIEVREVGVAVSRQRVAGRRS